MNNVAPTEEAHNLLLEVAGLISGDKAVEHGEMFALHSAIAQLWTTYLTAANKAAVSVEPEDVASLMELLKIARRVHGEKKRDHYMDAAGYAAISYAVAYDRFK